jgi:hypothetical protein
MARASALSLLQHESPTVEVVVPGTDLAILCRIPDALTQMSHGRLSLPLLASVVSKIRAWKDIMPDPDTMRDDLEAAATVIDDWVCYVALDPRIAKGGPDVVVPDGYVDIDLMRLTTKMEIVRQTTIRMNEEARGLSQREETFRMGQPDGEVAGSDSAEV